MPAKLGAAALACCLLASGCGGTRQDAHEQSATYTMEVVHHSFPAHQVIARPTTMRIVVRNASASTVPNVAVTVDSFTYESTYPELASSTRPTWVIERGPGRIAIPPVQTQEVSQPGSGQTAYVKTWALGPLAPGASKPFAWRVTPVRGGIFTVHYAVAAGLAGKARARTAAGGPVVGRFVVIVAPAPPQTYVDPNTGKVVEGTAPPRP